MVDILRPTADKHKPIAGTHKGGQPGSVFIAVFQADDIKTCFLGKLCKLVGTENLLVAERRRGIERIQIQRNLSAGETIEPFAETVGHRVPRRRIDKQHSPGSQDALHRFHSLRREVDMLDNIPQGHQIKTAGIFLLLAELFDRMRK